MMFNIRHFYYYSFMYESWKKYQPIQIMFSDSKY